MTEIIIRISLRYVAAFLAATGLLTHEVGSTVASNPDIAHGIEIGLGLLVGLAAECWYWATGRIAQPNEIERPRLPQTSISKPMSRERRSKSPRRKQNGRAKAAKIAGAREPARA